MKPAVTYTPELAAKILEEIATGKSLRAVCREPDMPGESAVRKWVIEDRDGFSAHYARARDMGVDAMADETIEIADDGTNDFEYTEITPGVTARSPLDQEHVQRSKLRVDTRKWYLSHIAPKKYGDRMNMQLTGANGGPVRIENDDAAAAKLAAILNAIERRIAVDGSDLV